MRHQLVVQTLAGYVVPSYGKPIGNMLQTMLLCQTSREVRKLNSATGDIEFNQMFYGRLVNVPKSGAYTGMADSTYAHEFFGCLNPLDICLYTFFCCPCAMGDASAMVQERRCDLLDCLSHFSPYELRKTVLTKYGITHPPESYFLGQELKPCCAGIAECLKEREEDIQDGLCAILCFCCQVNQDYKELKQRSMKSVYMPSYGSSQMGIGVHG